MSNSSSANLKAYEIQNACSDCGCLDVVGTGALLSLRVSGFLGAGQWIALEGRVRSTGLRLLSAGRGVVDSVLDQEATPALDEESELMNALNIAFTAYLPVLIGGLVATIACLLAGSRCWSRRLCAVNLGSSGLLLLLLVGLFIQGAISTGWYHGDAGMAGGILFLALVPLAAEFFGLLAVAWRIRARRTQQEPQSPVPGATGGDNR
jgi:hypothetical protein